jgi:hypothetical protein
MQIGLGGKRLKPGDLSRLWLNGRYFHPDLDKRQQLASAPAIHPRLDAIRHRELRH